MPLASIGGTEMVHTDILECLKANHIYVYIRYRTNVWKGRQWASTPDALKEGTTMLPVWQKMGIPVSFMSPFLEAPRLGRIIRYLYVRRLAFKINRVADPVVIFWHRESLEKILPHLRDHVHIIDIVHNNTGKPEPDPVYLMADWAQRINQRITVGPFLNKMLSQLYTNIGLPQQLMERVTTIPHKVYIPQNAPHKDDDNKPIQVLFAGRNSVEKRFHLVLRIIEFFSETPSRFHFHIAGPEPADFPGWVMRPNITWYGMVTSAEKMQKIYTLADILLLTSYSEGFPKVIAEAGAYEVVPFSTDVGGISDFIKNGENGILIPSNTEEQVYSDMCKAISDIAVNRAKLTLWKKNIRTVCQENFSQDQFNARWQQVIQNA